LQIVQINYTYFPGNTHNKARSFQLKTFERAQQKELSRNRKSLSFNWRRLFKDVLMKCECKNICRKAESILSFSYQNIITEGTNMRPVKASAPQWTFSFISANW